MKVKEFVSLLSESVTNNAWLTAKTEDGKTVVGGRLYKHTCQSIYNSGRWEEGKEREIIEIDIYEDKDPLESEWDEDGNYYVTDWIDRTYIKLTVK